jgi:hypothetical protein
MNGSVNAITQVGNTIIAAGTFTSVSPAGTFANTADDVVRNRIFAFDATTGAIVSGFDPNLGGAANSLDTDGTSVYVAGSFGSVGGNTAIKRVVKLTAAGAVDSRFKAIPSSAVNEVVVRPGRVYVGGSFTSIKRGTVITQRGALAALNPTDGSVLADVNTAFTGVYDPAVGGATTIKRFDVSEDGTKLAAVGNFSTVDGQTRNQVAVLDVAGTAAVSPWATNRFDADHNNCAGVFDTFTRDIDFARNGNYFVISTTGAFAGGAHSGTMCDSITRWETQSTGNDPTWVDYTGGDTSYGVAVTGGAVYVGGHMRWMNNSFQGDQAGPGAVPRSGIAALDPVNGLPLSWNPGRDRGVGAQAMFATSAGLWVGSDTTRIGGKLQGRIAFLPLAGGKVIPTVNNPSLPRNLLLAQRSNCSQGGVLYRVNAAGRLLSETDDSDDWTTDDGRVNTGNSADWGGAPRVDSTVPACTTPDIFATERWDGGSANDGHEMRYSFPVTAGEAVKVRLYFANRCGCTSTVGSRVFDVSIDGELKLDDFDIVAAVGHDVGTMREFQVTSDGSVDIDFGHVTENPLINGIEIISAGSSGPTAAAGTLLRRSLDASGAAGAVSSVNSGMDWSSVRGGFLVNGTMYYGHSDGNLYARTYNTSTGALGAQRPVNLYDDPETGERIPFRIGTATGMFYDAATHRLYYTVGGDARLFYRYFTPESEVVGAETFTADNGGVDLSQVRGMMLASGKVFFGSPEGVLRSVDFSGGRLSGNPSVTNDDGTWSYRAIFAPN